VSNALFLLLDAVFLVDPLHALGRRLTLLQELSE
jgi:hypothetical protein